jgi:acetyl esterase/lipase
MQDRFLPLKNEWEETILANPGIPLWDKDCTPLYEPALGQPEPSIVPFLLGGAEARSSVIVCPGGGYEWKSPLEGAPVARWLNAQGFNAFVLDYRVSPYTIDRPVLDIARAIRLVRTSCRPWNLKADKIGVLGFSAGAHLAIMAATRFDGGNRASPDPVERCSSRPDAQILCYPAVSSKAFADGKQGSNWPDGPFGAECTAAQLKLLSGQKNVRASTPPAFLWGTADDSLAGDWLLYMNALRRKYVPFAAHIFPYGGHGIGLAANTPLACRWPKLCIDWLRDLGF